MLWTSGGVRQSDILRQHHRIDEVDDAIGGYDLRPHDARPLTCTLDPEL